MTDAIQDRILQAVFRLSRDTCPIDATVLGRVTGVSTTAAAEALVALERAGLVDASRARLTMLGLARACALGADQGGPVIARGRSAEPVASAAPGRREPPLAARGEPAMQHAFPLA